MTDLAKIRHYFYRARELPPSEVVKKGAIKVVQKLKHYRARWQAQLWGTGLSETQFRAALLPSLADEAVLLAYLRVGPSPAFFVDPAHRESLLAAINQRWPEAHRLTIAAANQVCDHIFDLLGSGPTPLGPAIDWHVDFKTGHPYQPRQYYKDMQPAFYPGGHDIKVPWELSRCQHFAWLGQAYWYTNDEKYAREFVAQVMDWLARNPPQFGPNWACTMDVAIRVVNWLWGYYFFKNSPSLSDEFLLAFHQALLLHGRHICANLEWSDWLTSNHYLANLVGLVYLGVLCPHFKEAQTWREFGLAELWREMFKQVYPDGVDFEASISYHRMVTEFFLSAIILCQLNQIPVPDDVLARLEKMLEFVMSYTKPDGCVPLIGDADNGRLHRLKVWAEPEQEWLDHRHLLAAGAILFERADFGWAAGQDWLEAFWLWGERASAFRAKLDQSSPTDGPAPSRLFPTGGLAILRRDDLYLIVDAGPTGQNGNGGHAHNDVLSFELYGYGQTWIVDPGVYTYTADYSQRNLFRSTAFHNTVRVDGVETNRFNERLLFQMQSDVNLELRRWRSQADYDYFEAEAQGWRLLEDQVHHRRRVFFDKVRKLYIIQDQVWGEQPHTIELFWHLPPQATCRPEEAAWIIQTPTAPGRGLAIIPRDSSGLSLEIQTGWVASGYGYHQPAPVTRLAWPARPVLEFAAAFIPFTGEYEAIAAELQSTAAQSWDSGFWPIVSQDDGRDAKNLDG